MTDNYKIITITKEQLISLEACPQGLGYFDSIAPSGTLTCELSPWLALMFSDAPNNWYYWLQEKGLVPPIIALKSNLREANFSEATFSEANFADSCFEQAMLSGCELYHCDLYKCNFRFACMDNAILSGCNLKYADFYKASLCDADLSGTNLSEAFVTDADLSWAFYPNGELPLGWIRNEYGFLVKE